MYTEFKLGDTVKVWPLPGCRVQAHAAIPGRFIDEAGEEVTWSTWHYELARSGALLFTDPRPVAAATVAAKPAAKKENV